MRTTRSGCSSAFSVLSAALARTRATCALCGLRAKRLTKAPTTTGKHKLQALDSGHSMERCSPRTRAETRAILFYRGVVRLFCRPRDTCGLGQTHHNGCHWSRVISSSVLAQTEKASPSGTCSSTAACFAISASRSRAPRPRIRLDAAVASSTS